MFYPDEVLSQYNVIRRKKIPAVNHRVPWSPLDSTSGRTQTRECNSRITETRFLFRYETWNSLHCGGTPKGTLLQSSASIHILGQAEIVKRIEMVSIPQPEKQATKQWQPMFTNPVKIWNDPRVRDSALDFWLSPAHWKMRCNPPSGETHCPSRRKPQNYWIWQANNLLSVRLFYLWVPSVEVSNSRSLCLKTTECSQRVADLLSHSFHSVKAIWENQTNFRKYDIDKNK